MQRSMRTMTRWIAATLLIVAAGGASARDALGVFGGWGAFHDPRPRRCFAIAEPAQRSSRGAWRPFASVAHWPGQNVRGQLHIRLRAKKMRGAPVYLAIDERRFRLIGGGADAWAPDRRADVAIIAAMRSGRSMSVETRDESGRAIVDAYRLRGAASAIDAAALACARLR